MSEQGPTGSRLAPEPPARRDFLGLLSLASAAGALFLGLLGLIRVVYAPVSPTGSRKFAFTLPENLPPGEPYPVPGKPVALVRDKEGLYALSLVCTHLGCIVKPSRGGFECPCHGSRFHLDGKVAKGPAPAPLPWFSVTLRGSKCIVDSSRKVPMGTKAVL